MDSNSRDLRFAYFILIVVVCTKHKVYAWKLDFVANFRMLWSLIICLEIVQCSHASMHAFTVDTCYTQYIKILSVGFYSGFAALAAQIPLVDRFRWSGWFYVFFGTIQMLITLLVFKEKWTDLKRTSIQCRRLPILSGIAVPFYVSLL